MMRFKKPVIYKQPYLTENIITYIGNKRKLLPNINTIIDNITRNNKTFDKCLDAFSGSGIVSRFLRYKGFIVYTNDLEPYTIPINKTFLTLNEDPLCDEDYNYLNNINSTNNPFFSKYYAPKNTNSPDLINERLFYTTENAIFIDGVLEQIQNWDENKKNAVLANLLYKMSKHINTSGVMKGFHNGFSGSKKQNLDRIMANITITPNYYINAPIGNVYNVKSEELFSVTNCPYMDITYIDPPYNSHQYSANYHLLNSAVKYDFYNPGLPTEKKSKVGIRKDNNKSDFCYKDKAVHAFTTLFNNLQTKYLIMSFNVDKPIKHKNMVIIQNRITTWVSF